MYAYIFAYRFIIKLNLYLNLLINFFFIKFNLFQVFYLKNQ